MFRRFALFAVALLSTLLLFLALRGATRWLLDSVNFGMDLGAGLILMALLALAASIPGAVYLIAAPAWPKQKRLVWTCAYTMTAVTLLLALQLIAPAFR